MSRTTDYVIEVTNKMNEKVNTIGRIYVPVTVTRQMMDDILCGAFETGIDHWCDGIELTTAHGEAERQGLWYAFPGFSYTLSTVDGEVFQIDEMAVLSGLERYCRWQSIQHGADPVPDFDNLDAGDYDGIIQFAVFNELVYG